MLLNVRIQIATTGSDGLGVNVGSVIIIEEMWP